MASNETRDERGAKRPAVDRRPTAVFGSGRLTIGGDKVSSCSGLGEGYDSEDRGGLQGSDRARQRSIAPHSSLASTHKPKPTALRSGVAAVVTLRAALLSFRTPIRVGVACALAIRAPDAESVLAAATDAAAGEAARAAATPTGDLGRTTDAGLGRGRGTAVVAT
jgi:hypothetical protein